MKRLILIASSLIFIFFGTAYAEFSTNNSTKISGDKLKEMLAGKARHCTIPSGRSWTWSFYEDGKLFAVSGGGESKGTWSINSGGAVCYDYDTGPWRSGICHTMYQNPDNPEELAYLGGSSGRFYSCKLIPIK